MRRGVSSSEGIREESEDCGRGYIVLDNTPGNGIVFNDEGLKGFAMKTPYPHRLSADRHRKGAGLYWVSPDES